MTLISVCALIAGFVVVTWGADVLLRGAVRIARHFGISPLATGLTVVAFGTSAPELAVSIGSVWSGQASIAVGNVIGSNIFNVLAILGLSALVAPLIVHKQLIRLDVPVMIAVSALAWWLCIDGTFGRIEGLIFTIGLFVYLGWTVWEARREGLEPDPEADPDLSGLRGRLWWNVGLVLVGLILLAGGAQMLVFGASSIARAFGVSELVIGLTIVAAGTSIPELATSVLASLRGQRDIAIGNVVGSNLFNLLCVMGITGLVAPTAIIIPSVAIGFDLPVMVAVAVVCLPIFFTGQVNRAQGGLLFFFYLAYTAYLIMTARHHHLLDEFQHLMMFGVLPATALVLAVGFVRTARRKLRARRS